MCAALKLQVSTDMNSVKYNPHLFLENKCLLSIWGKKRHVCKSGPVKLCVSGCGGGIFYSILIKYNRPFAVFG